MKMIHRTMVGISHGSRMTTLRRYSGSWSLNCGWSLWCGHGCCESWSGESGFSDSWQGRRTSSSMDIMGLSTFNDEAIVFL